MSTIYISASHSSFSEFYSRSTSKTTWHMPLFKNRCRYMKGRVSINFDLIITEIWVSIHLMCSNKKLRCCGHFKTSPPLPPPKKKQTILISAKCNDKCAKEIYVLFSTWFSMTLFSEWDSFQKIFVNKKKIGKFGLY